MSAIVFARGEAFDQLGGAHRFVVLVVAHQRFPNFEMPQQISGVPRVFGGDQVDGFENRERAQSNVVEIADGRRRRHRAWRIIFRQPAGANR